jgi:hypothetical protein
MGRETGPFIRRFEMSDYTATCYGVGNSRKGGDRTTSALRNPVDNVNKGQKSVRFVIAAGSQIQGGEIWVNGTTAIAANDTLTLTVTAG